MLNFICLDIGSTLQTSHSTVLVARLDQVITRLEKFLGNSNSTKMTRTHYCSSARCFHSPGLLK